MELEQVPLHSAQALFDLLTHHNGYLSERKFGTFRDLLYLCTRNVQTTTIMTAIIERTPRTVTVRMSTRRWNRLQQMEQALQQPKGSNAKHHYRHEALCGMFKSDATEAELVEEYLTEKYNL